MTTKKPNGVTPFYGAAQNGHDAVVTYFIQKGYDINEKNRLSGLSALHIASASGRLGVVRILLSQQDIQIDALNNFLSFLTNESGEQVPLAFSLRLGNISLNPAEHNRYSALHLACIWGQEAIVRELITHGADISLKTTGGMTALDFAQEKGHDKIVLLLKAAQSRCAYCYKMEKTHSCARCKESFYCNVDCQRKHWAHHKAVCAKK